jgi:protocatechuate 3,4-dioxygenase beta subunit
MRTLLLAIVSAALASSAATALGAPQGQCTPTPSDSFGRDPGPVALRAKIGTGHVLSGVVLSPSCTPIAHATVTFWQSNAKGVYTTAGEGAVVTSNAGRFRFEGPMPTSYDGRPAHIHIKVVARDYQTLYTEYLPHGDGRGSLRLVLVPAAL